MIERTQKNRDIIMGRLLNYPECCIQWFSNKDWSTILYSERHLPHTSDGCGFRTCPIHDDFTPEQIFELIGRQPNRQDICNWKEIHNTFDRTEDWSNIDIKIRFKSKEEMTNIILERIKNSGRFQ